VLVHALVLILVHAINLVLVQALVPVLALVLVLVLVHACWSLFLFCSCHCSCTRPCPVLLCFVMFCYVLLCTSTSSSPILDVCTYRKTLVPTTSPAQLALLSTSTSFFPSKRFKDNSIYARRRAARSSSALHTIPPALPGL
jgi:hypothetical protein